MNCIAGSGRKLEPSVKFQHQLDNLCVTTSLSSAESDRIIAKSLEINLKDQYGNDAIFPENSFVRCKLFRLSYDDTNHSNPRDVPYFVDPAPGREFSGVEHLVSIPVTQYCHSFPLIQLQASEDTFGGDGNLELIFELCSTEHFHVSHIEKFAFHLRFTTDEGQASKERQFRDEVSPFQEQLEHLRMNLDQSEHEKLTLERKMKDVIRRANGLHLGEYLSTSQLTQSEVCMY